MTIKTVEPQNIGRHQTTAQLFIVSCPTFAKQTDRSQRIPYSKVKVRILLLGSTDNLGPNVTELQFNSDRLCSTCGSTEVIEDVHFKISSILLEPSVSRDRMRTTSKVTRLIL